MYSTYNVKLGNKEKVCLADWEELRRSLVLTENYIKLLAN